MPFEQLLLHVRHAGGGEQRGQHVFVREDVVEDGAGFDDAGPADGAGHAVAAFPVTGLLVAEGRRAAVGPGEFLRAVVGGIHDDGVVLEAEFLELVEELADVVVVLDHAVGIDAETGLAFAHCGLRCVQMCMRVAFHQRKNGLSAFFASVMKRSASLVNSSSTVLHALLVERAGLLDLLRAVRVRPGMNHAARVHISCCISGSLK